MVQRSQIQYHTQFNCINIVEKAQAADGHALVQLEHNLAVLFYAQVKIGFKTVKATQTR